jgi:membrane protein YdbS with pleckstrin-like domain
MRFFRVVSTKDIHVIRVLFIIILFWLSVSELAYNVIDYINKKYNIKRWKIHCTLVFVLLFIIILDPYTFEKL